MRPGSARTPAAIALLTCVTAVAQAQTVRDSLARDSAAVRLQAVTVTTSRAAGVAGGASAILIRPQMMRSSPAPLLEQALREAPFVHVRQNSRGEMELSVRGSDARQAAVLLDGVPISLGWDHRADPSLIPVTGARTLTIVRGLGSLLLGPNTLGGTIEVRHDDGIGGPVASGLRAGMGVDDQAAVVGSLGASRRMEGVAGGALSLEGGLAYRQRDGVALPDDAIDPTSEDGLRTNSDLRQVDGFASLRWRSAMGWRLGLTLSAFNAERGVPPEEHIAEPRLWRYPYNRRALVALSLGTGSFRTPLGHASVEVGAGYNTGKLKIETFSDRTYSTVDDEELGRERTWTGRAMLTHSVGDWASFKAAFTAADIRYAETLVPDPVANYRQTMLSVGAELEVPIRDRTTLSAGAVFDRSATPETGGRTAQEPFTNPGWRAGLSHQLSSSVRLHASASQRSRFPALRELYSGALNRFLPNPDLKPETLLGFEGGFTASRSLGSSTQGTLHLTGFRHNLDDAVIRITLPAPDQRFQRVNRDRIESYGAELLLGLSFGKTGRRPVTLTGDALLQDITIHDITQAGEPTRHAENNPATRATLELGLPLPLELRGFANARYTGTQYCLNADTGDEMRLAGRVESDLALERTFPLASRAFRAVSALVALDNITDKAVFDQCGLPQPGRTLRLMITLR